MVQIFSRAEELQSLRKRFASRRSTLVHGPPGVGKTLLLQQVIPEFDHVLYCPASSSPQAAFRCLAGLLAARHDATVLRICKDRADVLHSKSSVSLKGIVSDALRAEKYLIVLDHLHRPTPALGAMIGEVMVSCSTPVVAVARSAHMEDAGYVSPLLPDRSERLAIKNFDPETAKAFALEVSLQQQLEAENLNSVLNSMIKSSEGNPGAIVRLIAMAAESKYRSDDHIKWAPLYIDFLMEWAAANAV
jgi:ATP/maltotriose-dependent transcriptional regulator MalT